MIEITKNGMDDGQGKCSIDGVLGGFFQEIIDSVSVHIDRCVIKESDTIAVYNQATKLYDGAVGNLQTNSTDMILMPTYYPLVDPDLEYFDYTVPFHEDRMMIICAYNSTFIPKEKDIMAMFTSVSYKLWIAVFFAYLLFAMMLKTGFWFYGHKDKCPYWLVTCAFLFEDNFPDDTKYDKVVNLSAGIFLFFFGNYLMNSMSSDLVVYKNPTVIATYQEALDWVEAGPKLEIIFPPQLPETGFFKNAPTGTVESKLWKMRSDKFEMKAAGITQLPKLAVPIVRMEVIVIMRDSMARAVTVWALQKVMEIPIEKYLDFKAVLNIDPDSDGLTNVIVFRNCLSADIKAVIKKAVKRMTTGGIQEKAFDDLAVKMSYGKSDFILGSKTSKTVMTPESAVPFVKLLNTKKVWIINGSMIAFAAVILAFELVDKKNFLEIVKAKFSSKKKSSKVTKVTKVVKVTTYKVVRPVTVKVSKATNGKRMAVRCTSAKA